MKIEYDGKFTIGYTTSYGTESAFRCEPELAKQIAAIPKMMALLKNTINRYMRDDFCLVCHNENQHHIKCEIGIAQAILKEAKE